MAFSKNGGEYSYAINQEGELEVFSAKEEKMIWTLDTAAIQSFVDETIETEDGIQFVEALDTHRAIVFIGKDSVVKDVHAYALVIDADSRSIISGFPLEEPIISYRTAAVSCNERYLVYEAQSLNSMCTILKKGLRLNAFWQKQVIKSISLQMCRFVKTEVKLQLERKKDLLYMI